MGAGMFGRCTQTTAGPNRFGSRKKQTIETWRYDRSIQPN